MGHLMTFLVALVALVTLGDARDRLEFCTKVSQCACKDNTGKIMRLDDDAAKSFHALPFAALHPGYAGFLQYVISPCYSYDLKVGNCRQLGAGRKFGSACNVLGDASSSHFEVADGHLNLIFGSPSGASSLTMRLVCSDIDFSPVATVGATFVSERRPNHVVVNFTTPNVCRYVHDSWRG